MSIVRVPQKQPLPIDQDDLISYLKDSQNLDELDIRRRLIVIGLGGAGCNAIRNLEKLTLDSCVRLLAVNTDLEDLRKVQNEHRFLIGAKTTRGQGAGSKPERGQRAMEEQLEQLLERIGEVDMAIVVAGMGGGTGTGSAAVLIEALKARGVMALAQITMPQKSDGFVRMERAIIGKAKVEAVASATITILNDNLPAVMGENARFQDALRYADSVLIDGLTNMLDVMTILGVDNLDYADIESAFSGGGKTMMSVGRAEGEGCEIKALEGALYHPLIEPCNIRSATQGMICIMGGESDENSLMTRTRVLERLHRELDSYCDIKPGYVEIPGLVGIRILIILSGMEVAPANSNEAGRAIRISPKAARDGFKLVETGYGQSAPGKVEAEASPAPIAESPAASAPQPEFRTLLDEALAPLPEPMNSPVIRESAATKRSEPQPNGSRIRGPMGIIGGMIMKNATSAQPVEAISPADPADEIDELAQVSLAEEHNIAEAMNIPSMPIFLNKNAS